MKGSEIHLHQEVFFTTGNKKSKIKLSTKVLEETMPFVMDRTKSTNAAPVSEEFVLSI